MSALRYLPFVARSLKRNGPPLHLTLFVTGRCNLRCRHCFHWKEVAESKAGPSLAEIGKLADSAARMGPILWVSFGGGEPFLRDDLPACAEAFGRHGLRHLAIPTNGLVEGQLAAAEEILARCPQTFLSLSFSIDGPPDEHDRIRDRKGAHAGTIERVRAALELAKRHDRLGVGIISTLTGGNQAVLADHLDELCRDVRPQHLTINLARTAALDASELNVDPQRYRELVATKDRLQRDGVLGGYDFPLAKLLRARDRRMHDLVARTAEDRNDDPPPCTAARLSAVIFEDGEVRACEVLGDSIGRLSEVDWNLERLWNEARAVELRRKIIDTRCKCTWECAQGDNVLFRPREWPGLVLESLRS
jgi:MoaA/NifB/PqqE/SkfB family radical SAM enzyme